MGMQTSARGRFVDEGHAWSLLMEHGRSGTAYMTLWPGNCLFFGPERACYIAYRRTTRVALALGDPVGPPDLLMPTIAAFAVHCHAHGWGHAFYATTGHALPAYLRLGYQALKIGEEALISLPGLAFTGKRWQDVRTALNRAARNGITFHLYEGGTVPVAVRDQLFTISERWMHGKEIPEMGFTLGKVTDIDDPHVCVAVAMDASEKVLAFVDWLPMFAAGGWVLDLMRRAPDAPAGTMDFLIGSSLLAFQARGDRIVSLGAAPLANVSPSRNRPLLERVLGYVYTHADGIYHFSSLFAFKSKFQPRWEGIYLIYRSPFDIPRIGAATLRAYLPGGSLRALGTMLASRLPWRGVH
jgi:phosphatidylglycerol lysyltransferase